jgi:hypothetical protein
MRRPKGVVILAIAANFCLTGVALAQTSPDQPNANGVSNQFQSGARNVGSGFAQVGQGIKQGAILTWHAIVDGVTTTASHFNGTNGPAGQNHPSQ